MQRLVLFFALLLLWSVYGDNVWPQPSIMQRGGTTLRINPTSFLVLTDSHSSILKAAIQRYQMNLFFPFPSSQGGGANVLTKLNVFTKSDSEVLQFGVDETYNLSISLATRGADGVANFNAAIQAATVFGAIRGLETFSQLIDWQSTTSNYVVKSAPLFISDNPRFAWRGLLIDTARHYLDVATIKRTIDAMSYAKFNVLHWHTVDAQSFPVVSLTYNQLVKAAYAPQAIFTHQDILSIVQYGRERGVRVLPEFDIPGHAASWGVGYPEVTAKCPRYSANINNIALDPSNNFTFQVVEGLLSEMAALFSDEFLHVGGDEVVFGCWENDPKIVAWMRSQGFTKGEQVEQYFEDRLKAIVDKISLKYPKTLVVWQELFENGLSLDKSIVIEVWKDKPTLAQVVKAGFRGLLAAGWYLDQQIPNPDQTWYEWEDTWKNFYSNDPTSGLGLTPQQAALVLGGEAAMWGEQVDSTNFDSRVWPRGFAAAERLWSAASVNDASKALPRLVEFRCRVARRGIGAGPVAPDYCQLPAKH